MRHTNAAETAQQAAMTNTSCDDAKTLVLDPPSDVYVCETFPSF